MSDAYEKRIKDFVAELDDLLRLFILVKPAKFKGEPEELRGLAKGPGRLEVGARQYFVGRAVRQLSKQKFDGDKQPPLPPGGFSEDQLAEIYICKWCGEAVQAILDDECEARRGLYYRSFCPHGDSGCKGRCPNCPLPLNMWGLSKDKVIAENPPQRR